MLPLEFRLHNNAVIDPVGFANMSDVAGLSYESEKMRTGP
jgi:hypothetical protein